jgi:hypothetical protein
VWCQMEGANNLFTAPCKGHVFNLMCFSMLFDSKPHWARSNLPSQSVSGPLPLFVKE